MGAVRIVAQPSPNGPNGDRSGRDTKGRFTKGNQGGPGNPFARRVAKLRSTLLDAVTPDDIARLARRLLQQAVGGDTAAAKLLLLYTVGQPATAVDPDHIDLHELDIARKQPHLSELVLLANRADAARVAEVAAEIRPTAEQAYWRELRTLREKYGLTPVPIEFLP